MNTLLFFLKTQILYTEFANKIHLQNKNCSAQFIDFLYPF